MFRFLKNRKLFVFLFFLGFCYVRMCFSEWDAHQSLNQKIGNLIEEKKGLKLEYNELDIERESLQDPAYMELFLMEKLGLVPEGQIKVHFSDQ